MKIGFWFEKYMKIIFRSEILVKSLIGKDFFTETEHFSIDQLTKVFIQKWEPNLLLLKTDQLKMGRQEEIYFLMGEMVDLSLLMPSSTWMSGRKHIRRFIFLSNHLSSKYSSSGTGLPGIQDFTWYGNLSRLSWYIWVLFTSILFVARYAAEQLSFLAFYAGFCIVAAPGWENNRLPYNTRYIFIFTLRCRQWEPS